MNTIDKIRKGLGLGEKQSDGIEAPHTTLPPSFFSDEEVALRKAAADNVAPAPITEPQTTGDEPPAEALTEEEAMEQAAEKLGTIELGAGSWSLIDRALDSLSRNTGAGLDDPDAVQRAKEMAALVKATDNQLNVLVEAIALATPVLDRGAAVYSTLYRVLSQCVFFANLDYRQAEGMDAYANEATVQAFFERYVGSQYVEEALARVVDDQVLSEDDVREKIQSDQRSSDMGFEQRRDIELGYLADKYGVDAANIEEAVVAALQDIQLMFDLTAQVWGWPVDRPIAYANVQNPNGTYTPITDAMTALDAQEIKREAAQKRRREKRAETMSKAQELAAQIVAKSLQRPTVHRKS
jgi:hypothetical protein